MNLLKGLAAEKILCVVVVFQYIPFLVGGYWGKLMKVTNHQQLNTAEWLAVVTVLAEHIVDGIEQVASYHADFVDYQQVESAHNALFGLAHRVVALLGFHFASWHMNADWELEE